MAQVQALPKYGVHYYDAAAADTGLPARLGISPAGIAVYDPRNTEAPRVVRPTHCTMVRHGTMCSPLPIARRQVYPWAALGTVSFNKARFTMTMLPEERPAGGLRRDRPKSLLGRLACVHAGGRGRGSVCAHEAAGPFARGRGGQGHAVARKRPGRPWRHAR